jgi:general secretion pathway protein G
MKMTQFRQRNAEGFTLIELLITLVIMSILATIVLPIAQITIERQREERLQASLREIRSAIDQYKRAYDEGRILHEQGQTGYPPTLEMLVNGVDDAHDPKKSKIYFLRRIPRDPFATDGSVDSSASWSKRAYLSPPGNFEPGADVYDVSSKYPGMSLSNVPLASW